MFINDLVNIVFAPHSCYSSEKASLFSLGNRDSRAYKMAVKQGMEWDATYSLKTHGPALGGGSDLKIAPSLPNGAPASRLYYTWRVVD